MSSLFTEKKMHLTAKQISLLLLPFLITGIVYLFGFDIAKNIRHLFPAYKEYKNKTLDQKATIYLKLEADGKLYEAIKKKIEQRKKYAHWIVQTILYKAAPREKHVQKKRKKRTAWRLQAVFSKLKVAIINGTAVRENSYIYGAKVVKILDDKVLLKSKKGEKWLYLFH